MIPPFEPQTGYLPPGEHEAAWEDFAERFGTNERRRTLLQGLRQALESLATAGCQRVYIDGSFVTSAEQPNDFDGCWDTEGVDFDLLDATLLMFENRRAAQKARFGGEMFPSDTFADGDGRVFREFFQRDRDGIPKGIVVIDLRYL